MSARPIPLFTRLWLECHHEPDRAVCVVCALAAMVVGALLATGAIS